MKTNSYDDTKKMLNTLRKLNESRTKESTLIKEQEDLYRSSYPSKEDSVDTSDQFADDGSTDLNPSQPAEDSDYTVINDVEIVIHSEDSEDLELTEEEKGKVSQLIDDFRAEVEETVEFGKMDIYESSAKLTGNLGEYGLEFTLSTGDDTGLYINGQMIRVSEEFLSMLQNLNRYQTKYSSTINDLLVRRKTT